MADYRAIPSLRATHPVTVAFSGSPALASCADTQAAISDTISNDDATAERDDLVWFEFDSGATAWGAAPSSTANIELWMVRSIDGTNFETYGTGTGTERPDYLMGAFVLAAATTRQRRIIGPFRAPPVDFRVLAVNRAGQTVPASATLRAYFSHYAS